MRYIPVRQVADTRTARYRAVPPKIDRQWSISAVSGRLREKSTIEFEATSPTPGPAVAALQRRHSRCPAMRERVRGNFLRRSVSSRGRKSGRGRRRPTGGDGAQATRGRRWQASEDCARQISGGVCVGGFSVPRLEGGVSCYCWQQKKEAERMSHRENIGSGKGREEEGQQRHLQRRNRRCDLLEGKDWCWGYGGNQTQRRETMWNKERSEVEGALRAAILVARPAMLATAAAKGIATDCSDAAGCKGGDSGWAILATEEEDGSSGRSRGGWSGRQQRCGRRRTMGKG
ncbi:hypothetical protein BHM03_00042933 [Ensete ventricosum]|nr:hypothetical protein BHM03_00042933 [Ensete ventricosum]